MNPKYQRIAKDLELSIRSGEAPDKLPTEAQLCGRYECSRQTIRAALALLEIQGMIFRRRGSGAYVSAAAAEDGRRITFILPDREEYTTPSDLQEAQKTARAAGFTIGCLETRGDPEKEAEYLARLLRHPPAAIVLQPITDVLGCSSGLLLDKIREANIPLVYLNGRYDTRSPAILTGDDAGAGLLAAHLASAGHRKIAAILKWDESRGLARYRGLLESARGAGISFEPENCLWYCEAERTRLLEGNDAMLHRFFREVRGNCTAVVCFNDEIAYRLQRIAQARREELRLVSFDNSYLARDASITSLGTASSPAAAAVAYLTARLSIRSANLPSPPRLPWTLTLRRSG